MANSFGGGIGFLNSFKEENREFKDLGLIKKNIQELSARNYILNKTINLDHSTESGSVLEVLNQQLEHQDSVKNVNGIHSEITREERVIAIDNKSQMQLSNTLKQLDKKDRQQFKNSLQKVKSFNEEPKPSPRSRKAKSASPKIQKLSLEEKKTINNFFEKFENLMKDKVNFSEELVQASGERIADKQIQHSCLSCISKNLKTIGWTSEELNTFEKKPSYGKNPISAHMYYQLNKALTKSKAQSTWGNWNTNAHPYRYLFNSEEEWLNSLGQISSSWEKYHNYMNSGARIAASVFTFGMAGSSQKSIYEKRIDESKASLELRIGTKLMKIMNQIS